MQNRQRLLAARLLGLTRQFPIVVISGARQVGKTTLATMVLPEWRFVTFDPSIDIGAARADPDLFLDNHPPPIILDEIQYAPELVSAIKRRVDRSKKPGQYLLTGSQQWGVLHSISESLAGRAVFLDLEGFSLVELAGDVREEHWLGRYLHSPEEFVKFQLRGTPRRPPRRTLFEQLWRGFLPEADAIEAQWIPDFHRAYLRTYLERDARLLAEVSDWQLFGRFVQLAAALTSQEINRSQLGRELGITPQTAQRWLAMLRATFQWYESPAFHGNTVKRISGRHKGYLSDTGLACSLQSISTPETLAGHPLAGALFETAVVAEVRKLSASLATPPNILHWRTHAGAEVDILLERDNRLYPIEAKLSTQPTRGDARGINALRETYPKRDIAPGLIICAVSQAQHVTKMDLAVPWTEA